MYAHTWKMCTVKTCFHGFENLCTKVNLFFILFFHKLFEVPLYIYIQDYVQE